MTPTHYVFLWELIFCLIHYVQPPENTCLHQASVLAEDYSLTPKGTFSKDAQSGAGSKGNHSGGASGSASGKSSNGTRQLDGLRSSKHNVPVCFYCKKKGHVIAECWKQEKKTAWPNSLAVPHHVQPKSDSRLVPLSLHEQFNPFVSKGSVSLSKEGVQVPITILRDTGATQSLIVEGT